MRDVEAQKPASRAHDQPTDLGEWWQFRGNCTLTGRSALRGAIQQPAVQWQRFCGARESYLALELGSSATNPQTLALPTTDLHSEQWQRMAMEWGIEGPWFDLDGNGAAQSIAPELHHKLDHLVPDDSAWYRLQFESVFNTPSATVASDSQPVYGRLLRRAAGEWQQVWQSEPIPLLFHANAIVAYAPDGRALWQRDFDRFPGALPPWNIGGLTYYFAGRFTDPNRCDVLVHLRRNTMHSDESYLIDGRTGETIWHRTQGPDIWGCGGGWIAAYDFDHDGLDDVLTWYPHVFFGLQGHSGNLMLWEICNKIFNCPAFYANPVVADVLNEGEPQLFFAGSAYVLGLMDKDKQVRWRSDPSSGTPAVTQCLGDMDGDGALELVGPGYLQTLDATRQEFRAYAAATGKLKWRLPLPGSGFIGNNVGFPDSPTMPVVADLDGDGRDECIFAVVNTLYAIGATADGNAGEVRWTLDFPDRLGTASIADASGDGTLQILVACADGYVYGIGAH